jgi:CCR4-NOT transcription complex subunit 7/8
VAFGGTYDFAFMVKKLTGRRPLPETWHEFMAQAKADRLSHDQAISSN